MIRKLEMQVEEGKLNCEEEEVVKTGKRRRTDLSCEVEVEHVDMRRRANLKGRVGRKM